MPFFILPVLAAALVGGFTSFWITPPPRSRSGSRSRSSSTYVSDTGYTGASSRRCRSCHHRAAGGRVAKGFPSGGRSSRRCPRSAPARCAGAGSPASRPHSSRGSCSGSTISLHGGTDRLVRMGDRDALGGGAARIHRSAVAGAVRARRDRLARCARLVGERGWPVEFAAPLAVAVTIPVGLLFAIPALRTRGINLAVVTLGLAMGVNAMIFTNTTWVGSSGFTAVPPQHLFGIDIDPIAHSATTGSSRSSPSFSARSRSRASGAASSGGV